MDKWTGVYALAFAGAMGLSAGLTVVFRRIAWRTGFLDLPANNHKGHARATALLGGAAMFCSWLGMLALGWCAVTGGWLPESLREVWSGHVAGMKHVMGPLGFIGLGALLAVVLGLIDDKWALSAKSKFAGQFAVALIAVLGGGVRVNLFLDAPVLTAAVTVFWIVLMMNSINFFDNMDGLAAGTIAIAMGFFAVIAALNREYFVATFAALNCGVCCGFWIFNTSPASIFMGDSGSHFLGYLAALVAAQVTFFDKSYSLSRFPVLIPAFILALPLFDTAMVVAIRTCRRVPFWIGDHNHISHRFVRMGLSRRSAVALVHLMALTVALGALPVFWGDFKTGAVIVAQMFLLLIIITVIQLHLGEKNRGGD